jgi:hypothetical protein
VVQFSADVKSFESTMARLSGVTRKELNLIKKEAATSGAVADTAFAGAASGLQRYGNAASRAAHSQRTLVGQTGNLAAQFQDIAVQLQAGTSPLTVALQQGTQISAVLGGQGAGGAVKALGAALLSVVSPVSLVTIGLIAAGGAAVQYFGSLLGEGDKSAEELKRQSSLIQQVAKDWGTLVPAVKAYADAVAEAQSVADLRESGQVLRAEAYGTAKEQVESLSTALVVLRSDLELLAGPEQVSSISDLQSAFNELQSKVEDNTATAEDAQRVQDALNAVMALGAPTAETFAGSLGILAGALGGAADQAARAESQIAAATSAMRQFRAADALSMKNLEVSEATGKREIQRIEDENNLTREQIELKREAASITDEVTGAGGVIDPDTADRLATERLSAEDRRAELARTERKAASSGGGGGGGGRSAAVSEAQREREAVTKLVEQLEFEQSILGATDLEREKAITLRRAGAAATDAERARIEEIVTATYAQTEALQAQQDQYESLRNLSHDVIGGLAEDLRDGVSGAELLSNALNRVAESLIKAGVDNLTAGLFPTGGATRPGGIFGGAIIPGILHSGGVAGSDGYGHGRSFSPAAFVNAPRYHTGGVAGFRPGEVPAVLQRGEVVLPRGASVSGGGTSVVEVRISADVEARVLEQAANQSVRITQAGIGANNSTLPSRVSRISNDPRRR